MNQSGCHRMSQDFFNTAHFIQQARLLRIPKDPEG